MDHHDPNSQQYMRGGAPPKREDNLVLKMSQGGAFGSKNAKVEVGVEGGVDEVVGLKKGWR